MVERWRIILAAMVIFIAGAATGAMAVRVYAPKVVTKTLPPATQKGSQDYHHDYVSKLERELQLTPEQKQRIEAILVASQDRMKQFWRKEEFQRTREEISEVLTPEQREKKKQLRRERERAGEKKAGSAAPQKSGVKPEACLGPKCKAC